MRCIPHSFILIFSLSALAFRCHHAGEDSFDSGSDTDSETVDTGDTETNEEECDGAEYATFKLDFDAPIWKAVWIDECRFAVIEADLSSNFSTLHIIARDGTVQITRDIDFTAVNIAASTDALIISGQEKLDDSDVGIVLATDLDGTPKWVYRDEWYYLIALALPLPHANQLAVLGSSNEFWWDHHYTQEKIVFLDENGEFEKQFLVPMPPSHPDWYHLSPPLHPKRATSNTKGQISICGSATATGHGVGGQLLDLMGAGFTARYSDGDTWHWDWISMFWQGDISFGNCRIDTNTQIITLAGGRIGSHKDKIHDMFVAVIEHNGQELASQSYPSPGKDTIARDLLIQDDSSIIVVGSEKESKSTKYEKPFIAQIDKDLNLEWKEILDFSGSPKAIEQSIEGGLLIAGQTPDGGFLISCDQNGVWK